ncbi:uncharacterized protein LOC132561136 [Ylistrum balloti]|uniref:uncharacterized protein LOC132561136 n=1 Tax=Ylistrum balloti TaxID=509963 RepID=UPI00290582C6|nr:uncharacterized protein LOC132561136 [Ylistrum balloti]
MAKVIERTKGLEREDDDSESVYLYSSRPTTPGERKGLLVRFQLVSRTQPCVAYHYMSVNLNSKLSELRRPVNAHFKTHFDGGFIFLCKTKEVINSRERQLTIFDILPKLPNLAVTQSYNRTDRRQKMPSDSFLYPGVHYKELSHDIDGRRHLVTCACVVFLFERSKVSHWPADKLQEELSAGMLEGFSFIPSDIMSWKEKLVENRATAIHGYAACNQKKELETAIHQLPGNTYVQNLKDQRGAVPLHYAAESGHLEICELLIAAIGKDLIFQQDVNQKTPLHCALYRRKLQTAVYLLQLNSDLTRKDVYGNSCIDLLLQQSSKDLDFIISKLQTDCIDEVLKYHITWFALKKRDIKISRKITASVQPVVDDNLGEDLLHIAADMGDKDVVGHLISNKFSLSKRDVNGFLPFHRACAKGNEDVAYLLLYPDMEDSDVCKGVSLAVKQKCYTICSEIQMMKPSLVMDESFVCTLIEHIDTILSKVSKDGKSREKELKDWEKLLKNVIPLLQKEDGVLETYVFDCARHNLPNSLMLLKSIGANFNDRDFMGRSPLHEAAERDSCKAINELLNGNCNPNAVDWRGGSPLHYACAKGHLQSVKVLLSSNKQVEAGNQNASGRTPLLAAAYSGKFEVVQFLVSNYASKINISATDSYGQCILHHLVGMPEKIADLVLAKYFSVEKTEKGKYFKRTLWVDSVKHSGWCREIIVSRFRATVLDMSKEKGKVYFTDSETDEKLEGPFNHGLRVASWNSRKGIESTTNLKPRKSPKKETNACTRCKDFVGMLSAYRGPHKCTLAGKKRHEGEGEIRKIAHKAFKHHYIFQQEVISPVFNAVKTGNILLVKKLVKFNPEYINQTDNFGRSLIELAIDRGSVKVVQTLLDLLPSQPNPSLVYRVLMQKKKSKSDNTRKVLLSSLIAKGHLVDKRLETGKVTHDGCSIQKGKFCYKQCYLKGYTPLEVVVRNNDEDVFKMVLDKSSRRNKSVALLIAAYKGHHAMLETVKRKTYSQKKDKNEDEDDEEDDNKDEDEIDERVLLDIACRSPHITTDLIKVLGKLYPEMMEQNTQGILTEHPVNRQYLLFDIPKKKFPESTSLGKILSRVYDRKSRIFLKSKIEDIACQLIDEGINLGKVYLNTHSQRTNADKFLHGCCECFLAAMEGKFYKVAERILNKDVSTIWKCAMSETPCRFQHSFKKRMMDRKMNHMHEPQYIDYMLLLACSAEVPKTILQVLLQTGIKEFNKDTGPLDDMDEITRSKVENIKDPFLQKAVYIAQLMSIQRKGTPDIFRLIKMLPNIFNILQHVDSKLFKQPTCRDGISCFIRTCCDLSISGRCGYDKRLAANGKVEYVPVDLPEGLHLLHMVCALDNVEYVKDFIKCGTDIDINKVSTNGIRAVDVAAACGNWPVYKFLIDKKAEINSDTLLACCAKDRHKDMHFWMDRLHTVYGETSALEKHRLKIAKDLCSRNDKVKPSYCSDSGDNPLGAALKSKLWSVAEFLCTVNAGAAVLPMLQGIRSDRKPEWALEAPKDLLRMIVEASVKFFSSATESSSTPIPFLLQTITKRSDFKLVDSMVKLLDALITGNEKWLEMCCQSDQHEMTILHYLSQIGHTRGLETILKRIPANISRKKIINQYDSADASALWYALANKHWSTASLLLISGANGYNERAIPGFEPKQCAYGKQDVQTGQGTRLKTASVENGIDISSNAGNNVTLCLASSSSFFSDKKETVSDTNTNQKENRHSTKTDPEKVAVKRLLKIAQAADAAGCDIIHAACATRNYELVQEILRIHPDAFRQKDDQGYFPFAYAVIGGSKEVIDVLKENMTGEIAEKSLEPFIWKMASSEKRNLLDRAFSQLLAHIYDEKREFFEDHTKETDVKLSPFRWGELYSSTIWQEKQKILKSCLKQDELVGNDIEQVMEHIDVLRNVLLRTHPLDSFLYLNPVNDTYLPEEYAESLLTLLLNHITDINPSSILSLVMMQKSWILKELKKSNVANTIKAMKKQILWKYSVVDCIFIFASPEDERNFSDGINQLRIDKELKEIMGKYSLNLSSGIGSLAVQKNLWVFLEHVLFQTFENEGSLSDKWHSILATAAERGQLPFLRSILDKLHIPRMTAEQRSCFTAYLCLACRAGKTDVVKYLLRHNVPTVGSMDEYPIRDILGKRHENSWNILQYVFYSKSESTLKEILSVLKTEKEFLRTLQVDECIKQSGKTGSPGIVHQMTQFLSMTKNECVTPREWDLMLQTASSRGYEDLCIYLIEKQSADECSTDNSNMSPLHYCGYYGMEKLASVIIEKRPSALGNTDIRGLTPKDYANAMGRPQLFKGSTQTLKQLASECVGWLRCLLKENSLIQQSSSEVIISPHVFALRELTLQNLLLRTDDHASENIIKWSSWEFVRLAENEPQKCVEIFIQAAAHKCNKALRALCDVLQTTTDSKHNLQSLLLMDGKLSDGQAKRSATGRRGNGLTPLGWAIYSQNMEGVDILMEKEACLTWRETFSLENILHLAVKTGNLSIAKHVNDKTDGKLISEEDRQKVTPLAVAVALGHHRTFRLLTKNKLKSVSSNHDKHGGNRIDYGCVDCLLDNCIGWSKIYHSGDSEMISTEDEDTRVIFQKKNNRGYVLEHMPMRICKVPIDVQHMCEVNSEEKTYRLHKIHYISKLCGLDSNLVKSALFSMGYKANEETMQWIILRSLTDPSEAAKKAVRFGFNELAIKFIPQLNDEQTFDVFETAAVNGNYHLLEQCQERLNSLITNAIGTRSIIESAVAFGNIALSIRLLRFTESLGQIEQFNSFQNMIDAIPQKLLWLIGDQVPGNDEWSKDIEHGERLTLPDVWLSLEETDPLRSFIEERIIIDKLLPDTINGKKFVADKESFRKHSYFKEKGNIWIGCFISSSQIFGHVKDALNTDDPKTATVNTIKVACLPPGSSDHPKLSFETNGTLLDSIAVAIHNETPVLQLDPSLIIRAKETSLKDIVQSDVIPAMEQQIKTEFGMPIRIRVDWNSIDTRKRTSGSETAMKALTGDNFNNKLGGLQDVLNDCIETKDTIKHLFNDETVTLALKPVTVVKFITVTLVDSISVSDGQKKSRVTAPDSNILWNFSMERSTLKYDRTTFPLWFHLNRYRTACVAFCDSIYRISYLPSYNKEWVFSLHLRRKRDVTFEMEWSSFQTTDEKTFMDLVGHGIARELQVMACETQAMLRLTIDSNHVTVKNSASALYTGISLDTHGKSVTASVYIHQTAKKTWVVEDGRTAAKLGDLEDKQLSHGDWQKETYSMVKEYIANARKVAENRFGFSIDILFDEKRILAPLLLKCRREAAHPHELVQRSMKEFLEKLIIVYEEAMNQVLSGPYTSYSFYMQDLDVPSGIWKDYEKRNGKTSKSNKTLVLRKYKTDRSHKCIEDYNYSNRFEMQQVSQGDIEDETNVSKCYEFMYPTSKLMDRSHTDHSQHIRFVSCLGKMYEIVDQNALMRALSKLPTKAVMGHDALDILELFGSERLFIKLFPALTKDIQLSSVSSTIPVMYDSFYRINCLQRVHHIDHFVINWDDLFESKRANKDENLLNVQSFIRTLEDVLIWTYRKEGLPCNIVENRNKVSKMSLIKISSLHLTKLSDDFRPDASVVRIIQPKEKSQPHVYLRQGNALTVAFQNFKDIGMFYEILLTTAVHVLEVEVKIFIETSIAQPHEKDKWRKKQYDGPDPIRPDLCYVENILPNILSCLGDIINTTEGKEALMAGFVDFQFARSESNRTTIKFEDGWLICSISPEDMGANLNILFKSALGIKVNRNPALQYKGSGVYFTTQDENILEVMSENCHPNMLQMMCDTNYFTIQLLDREKKQPTYIKPLQALLDENQQAIQIKWKSVDRLPSNSMGHVKLMYRDALVERQINTYICKNVSRPTEIVTQGGGLEIQKGGKALIIVEHDTQCHVKGRQDMTATNQRTADIQNGIRIQTKANVDFLIKTGTRSFRQPFLPIKIKFLSGHNDAQCIELECLDTSRCMAAAMVRHGRPFRNVRSRIRHESGEEGVKLDLSKDPGENVKEILSIATVHLHVHKTKKLGYLNAFVKLLYKLGKEKSLGYSKQDILCCLRVSLFHEAKEVRAATLRVLRYFIQDGETLDLLYKLHMDYLIVRSIDMCLDNEVERIHAIKLVRRIAQLAPHRLTCSLIYPLVAIGNDGAGERDRMVRVCLSTICEIAFLNPELIAKCGGVGSILRAALDCHQYPRINESLVCTILHLLNHPRTRHLIKFNTDLEQLLAPFTDCHYRYSGAETSDHSGDDKENRFAASKMAVVSIMRSWPGIIRFCRPDGSGLQSLVGILYLPYYEIRQGIIEILYDLFRLQVPEWTDNFSAALLSVDPSMMRDSWRLTDGFICEEGRSLLPHMAKIRPNLVENHLALLLSAWIGAGIFDALVEVVISSDDQLFIRTTILLGQLMHMASTLLPNECSHHSHCLPTLMAMASAADIPQQQQHRACKAVSYLDRLHSMKKRGIVPRSLYLDHLIQNMGGRKSPFSKHFHQNKNRLNSYYINKLSSEDMVVQTVKDSQVLFTKDNYIWDWDLIASILKWPLDKQKKLDEQIMSRFMKRLIYFFKPTNHLFSRLDVGHKLATKIAHVGCLLMEFLMECGQEEIKKPFVDFINDIGQCLSEIGSKHLAAEAVLSPSNTISTCSQFYFLFLGKISVTAKGDKLLEKCSIYQYLLEIVSVAAQDSFVKLTVSGLSYNQEGNCRAILAKALCASTESARMFCTKFLRVLLRVRVPGFSTWGMELLTTQLYDQSRSISLAALGVMEEACEVDTCLNSLIKLRPSCLHLGEKGRLLTCRFMSTPRGFRALMDANYISNELEIWAKTFDTKYVSIVEELLNEALTTYEKTFEGSFSRRSSRKRPSKDAFLPVHLYGQLTQTKDGFQLLRQQEYVEEYFQCIRCQELMTDEDNVKLKTALWAVGHIGSSTWGVGWLDEERLFPEIIRLAEECGVFSIRGTAFYVLGLLASTREGAELLTQLGWESCWHSRGEMWPVVEDRAEMLSDIEDATESVLSFGSTSRSDPDYRTSLHSPGIASNNLFFIAEEEKTLISDGLACDNNHNRNIDTTNIPDNPKAAIIRSKTLPFESPTYRRYNSMPLQPRTAKKFSRSSKQRDRTLSDDSDKRLSPKDPLSPVSPSEYLPLASEFGSQNQSTSVSVKESNSEESTVIPVICLPDESSEPEPVSTDKDESVKDKEVTDSKVMLRQEGLDKSKVIKRSPIFRDGRSSSSESSRSSKNRADSFNTDSTTSGVSSCESGPNTYISSEVASLSPIASSTSLNTVGVKSVQQGSSLETKDLIHPSTVRRKSMNLHRVPSVRKVLGNPIYGILSSSRMEGLTSENAIMYTTSRDAYGYATWRSIKRQRTVSSDLDSDLGISNLYDEEGTTGTLSRKSSVDSKLSLDLFGGTASRLSLGMTRNASGVSLSEMDGRPSSPMGAMPKASLQKRRPHTGEAEFVGLTLPVDINMMFEVHEGEDKRSQSISGVFDRTEDVQTSRSRKVSSSGKRSRTSSSTTRGDGVTIGSDHDMSVCVACYRLQTIGQNDGLGDREDGIPDAEFESDGQGSVTVIEHEEDPGSLLEAVKQQKGDRRTRLDSLNELSSATPGSMTSCTSTDSSTKKMSFDSVHGRALIRQEIRKLVTNLSSSVGVKGSEQGLLGLKQKFPKVFQDVCFYSEVSHIMTICSFRLTARRFIQELFDEFDITKLLEEARCILGVVVETESTGPVTNKQDTLDSVWENIF